MNTETKRLLESFNDFAVQQIDEDIMTLEDRFNSSKSEKVQEKLGVKLRQLYKLRKQILWGV